MSCNSLSLYSNPQGIYTDVRMEVLSEGERGHRDTPDARLGSQISFLAKIVIPTATISELINYQPFPVFYTSQFSTDDPPPAFQKETHRDSIGGIM